MSLPGCLQRREKEKEKAIESLYSIVKCHRSHVMVGRQFSSPFDSLEGEGVDGKRHSHSLSRLNRQSNVSDP